MKYESTTVGVGPSSGSARRNGPGCTMAPAKVLAGSGSAALRAFACRRAAISVRALATVLKMLRRLERVLA